MEIMIIENAPLTMSSREIAELTGKQHGNVLRDIKNMLANLYGDEIDDSKLNHKLNQGVSVIRDNRGYVSEIRLDRSHTMTLVTGYDARLRKSVIDRMDELEKQVAQPAIDLSNPAVLRNALLNYTEKVLELENKLSEQQPKADGFDRIARAEGSMNLTNAAKSLNIRPKDLMDILQLKKWIYRRAGGKTFVGYQDKIQQGLLAHKVYSLTLPDGTERMSEQVVVNPKGLAKLSTLIPGWQAEAKAELIPTA